MVLGVDGSGIFSKGYGFSGNIIIQVLYFLKKIACVLKLLLLLLVIVNPTETCRFS